MGVSIVIIGNSTTKGKLNFQVLLQKQENLIQSHTQKLSALQHTQQKPICDGSTTELRHCLCYIYLC